LLPDCCGGGDGGGGGAHMRISLAELISTHMIVSTQATDVFLAFRGLIMKLPPPPETYQV